MLSYRHAFHAGGPADVLKHAVFCSVLAYAMRKEKPLYVLDTHAGAGAYDLRSAEAARTGEHRSGIARVLEALGPAPELLVPYLDRVRAANPAGAAERPVVAYPGSPELAAALLRPQDRLELAELHPTDHALLEARFRGRPRTRVARADGLALLLARVPPPERRGVVLVDPSYEVKTEPADVALALARARRRFATGVYILWYPVIERPRAEALLAEVAAGGDLGAATRGLLRLELCLSADAPGRGMTGSGLVVVNPPWRLAEAGAEGVAWLAARLGARGPVTCGWLVPPA